MGRDSSVDIATCHGLEGPRIEYRWGRAKFSAPIQTDPRSPTVVKWVLGLVPGGKATGAWL
jgi:hypothetical protein